MPGDATVHVDIRMTPHGPHTFEDIYTMVQLWADNCDISSIEFLQKPKMPNKNPSNLEGSWKLLIANTLTDLPYTFMTFPGATGKKLVDYLLFFNVFMGF